MDKSLRGSIILQVAMVIVALALAAVGYLNRYRQDNVGQEPQTAAPGLAP